VSQHAGRARNLGLEVEHRRPGEEQPEPLPNITRCLRSRKTRLAPSTAILKAMRDDPTLSLDQANLREDFRIVREPLFD
jgi:hypothetical protein